MHYKRKHSVNVFVLTVIILILGLSACQKSEDYYLDSGLAVPYFKGTTMDYLQSKPFYFDSVAFVAQLAEMDSLLAHDSVTFFAPTDRSILRLIKITNDYLYAQRYDTIRTLQDVPRVVWQKYLSRYMFHGYYKLKDYPQINYDQLVKFPGQGYLSWDGTPMNIGVVYHDNNGVKYVGYRQLSIAYIPDLSAPTEGWFKAYVASSNILTDNGVVHVLSDNHTYFGFSSSE